MTSLKEVECELAELSREWPIPAPVRSFIDRLLLSAAKPPASGVDAVAALLAEGRFLFSNFPRGNDSLTDFAHRAMDMLASLSPAATSGSEDDDPPEGNWFNHRSARAKPSSPAGGDVREVVQLRASLAECAHFIISPLRLSSDEEEAARRADMYARAIAALSPSTSAAEPVAWVIPGDDNARDDGSIDAMAWQEGEFTRPLYATPPAPAAVDGQRVKALEWVDDGKNSRADAGFEINYSAFRRADGRFDTVLLGTIIGDTRDTLDEAKAAAQADYEARIRACLATGVMARNALRRCNNCGCYVAGMWLDGLPKFDCARYEEATPGLPCKTTKIGLLEMALRRQLVPDAFDERARIKPGRIVEVLEAEREAMLSAAALLGPMPADALPHPRQESGHG